VFEEVSGAIAEAESKTEGARRLNLPLMQRVSWKCKATGQHFRVCSSTFTGNLEVYREEAYSERVGKEIHCRAGREVRPEVYNVHQAFLGRGAAGAIAGLGPEIRQLAPIKSSLEKILVWFEGQTTGIKKFQETWVVITSSKRPVTSGMGCCILLRTQQLSELLPEALVTPDTRLFTFSLF